MVSNSIDYNENGDYSNLCDEYNNIFFEESKAILPHCDIEHHIDLPDLYKNPSKLYQYRLN